MYLQYCIFVWNDKSKYLNNQLIDTYMAFLELAQQTDNDQQNTNLANEKFLKSCSKNHKQMLIYFLNETKNYEAMYALSKLDLDNFAEERAIKLCG